MYKRKLLTSILFAITYGSIGNAATIASSTWDNPAGGLDGWSFINDGTNVQRIGQGGNPGGFLQVTDLALGLTIYFVAPSKFLGNMAGAYGGTLTFDLQQSSDDRYYADTDVVLTGNGITLGFVTGANSAVTPAWSSNQVPLVASAGWKVGDLNGPPATEAQLKSVLANLTTLDIRGEFQNGPDVDGIDNVVLAGPSSVPEPGTVWLMLPAGALCYSMRRLITSALGRRIP